MGWGGLVFGDGLVFADAVNGGRRREGQPAHAVAAHAFKDVVSADGILPEIFIGGLAGDELDVGVGGQVIDHFDAGAIIDPVEGGIQLGGIQQVAFDEAEAGAAQQVRDVLHLAAAEVIDDGDLAAAVEQGCGEVRTDAARSAGDECV
jgi:hypothetical protein